MNKQKKPLYFYYLLILIVIVAGNMLFSAMEQSRIKDVSYNTFIKQTEQKKIDKVEIGDQSISYTLKNLYKSTHEGNESLAVLPDNGYPADYSAVLVR